MSLSSKSWWVSTPSSYAVLIRLSKSKASANQVRNIPQITQNLKTGIMLKVRIIRIFIIVFYTTSVGCLSDIRITEAFFLIPAGIDLVWTTHWNRYTKQIIQIMLCSKVEMISSPKGNEGNLLLTFITRVSHFLGDILQEFKCFQYYQICEENHHPARYIK